MNPSLPLTLLFSLLLLLLGGSAARSTHPVPAFASQKNLDHRNHQAAKNPEPAPGATHSTERREEPGRKRNYGTEFTKEKRQPSEDLIHEDEKGRKWTFGKVPRW